MTREIAPTFTEQMQQAIDDAPMSRYAISKKTGIHEAALSRFMKTGSGLSLASLDKLAELLGWELRYPTQKRRSSKRK